MLISDAIATAVCIGCGQDLEAWGFIPHEPIQAPWGRRMGGKCGTLSGSFRANRAAAGRFCCRWPRAQL